MCALSRYFRIWVVSRPRWNCSCHELVYPLLAVQCCTLWPKPDPY